MANKKARPTGLYFVFLVSREAGTEEKGDIYKYRNIYVPTLSVHFTIESAQEEAKRCKTGCGLYSEMVIVAFETTDRKAEVNGTPLLLEGLEHHTLLKIVHWIDEHDGPNSEMLRHFAGLIFKGVFAERILRQWLTNGRPENGLVQVST